MFLFFAIAVLISAFITPGAGAQPLEAGFERQITADGIEVGVWYPAAGKPSRQQIGLYAQDVIVGGGIPHEPCPLIVISHGTGGDFTSHVDTAVALAHSGFVVAALTHPGDNWRDNSRTTQVEKRPAALSRLITYMLTAWPGHSAIDPDRIGAFGFSAGGFTVLASAGGRPDLTRVTSHCAQHPDFFDCSLLKSHAHAPAAPWPDEHDARIKAIVVATPALGFAFDRAGLADVKIPVQLWRADDDHILPAPFYADAVRAALPVQPEFHSVPDAGHFDLLAPCVEPSNMPQICQSHPEFDRPAFHRRFNAEVVQFFRSALRQ